MNWFGHNIKTLVVKVGSNVLGDHESLRQDFFKNFSRDVALLCRSGIRVVIVSSGAIATAMTCLNKKQRPQSIQQKQAFAAVGQPVLMGEYLRVFGAESITVAQVLITQDDVVSRRRFLNAKNTFSELLDRGIVPIVNENDTVAVDELKFGDNDRLSASVAQLVDADLLLILSHVDGLYDSDPRKNKESKLIARVTQIDDTLRAHLFVSGENRSVGGMASKLVAAQSCMDFGIPVFITNGLNVAALGQLTRGETVPGTLFEPSQTPLAARKHWIGHVLKEQGKLILDAGAVQMIREQGKSLLPIGIKSLEGKFQRGDCVVLCDESGEHVAKGLVDYSCQELEKIKQRKSGDIESILGYSYGNEVVHRDNLVVM